MKENIETDAAVRMQKSVHALQDDLAKVRAGRAHPSLLDMLTILYYGNETPISQVATIGVEGALMLTVKPWEKQMVPVIEKAIRTSDLGLNPATSGDTIRVPLPPLSEERRRELIKHVRTEGEATKVAIRNIRRDANGQIKNLLRDKLISEDEDKRAQDKIQKLTDNHIVQVDSILTKKEKDLMAI